MPIQTINLGTYPNDGTGDDLRTAFQKVNANFTEVSSTVGIINGVNIGGGAGLFAQRNVANLEFKTLTSTNNTVVFGNTATTINLSAVTTVQNDTTPTLGGNLNTNGFNITGSGSANVSVFGHSVPVLSTLVAFIINSNMVDIDFGTFTIPTGIIPNVLPAGLPMDMGTFGDNLANVLDFGPFNQPAT